MAHFADRGVQRIVDVQHDIPSPDGFNDLLAEQELPSPVDEQAERLHRDSFETERSPRLSELEVGRIELKWAKS